MIRKRLNLIISVLLINLTIVAIIFIAKSLRDSPANPKFTVGSVGSAQPVATGESIGYGALTGTVVRLSDDQHGSALLAIQGPVRRSVEVDANGRFELTELPSGTYLISARAVGVVGFASCEIRANTQSFIEIRLAAEQDTVSLRGRVLDILGGRVPSAEVWIGTEDGGAVVARATESGDFSTRVQKGNHDVRVRAPAYAEVAEHVSLADDLYLELIVHPASTIRGVVVFTDGSPAPNARVRTLVKPDIPFEAITDHEGRFTFANLPSGSFRVEAVTNDEVGSVSVNLAPASVRDLRIELERGSIVTGVVHAKDGTPIAGADIDISPAGALRQKAKTDPVGAYRIGPVFLGPATIHACASRYQCVTEAMQVARGSGAVFDLTLLPAGRLHVRVIDKDDEPVSGARVYIATFTGCNTDREGQCLIDHASPSKTTLTAHHVTAGYAEESITIADGETKHEIRIAPGATVRGTVRWDDGKVAGGVHVFSLDIVTRTDPDGRYELRNVKPGFLHVRAATAIEVGLRREEQLFGIDNLNFLDKPQLLAGEVRNQVDLVLQRRRQKIEGRVVGSDNRPVAYAQVGLFRENAEFSFTDDNTDSQLFRNAATYSDNNGSFRIDHVADGKYTLWADAPDQPGGRTQHVPAGSDGVVIQLPAGATIEGNVTDEGGASVTAFTLRYGGLRGRVLRISNEQGHYTLLGMPAGKHSIVIEGFSATPDNNFASTQLGSAEVEVKAGERKITNIIVHAAVTVTGRVVAWPDMTPRPGITLNTGENPSRRTQTTDDGRFRFDGLLAGTVRFWTHDVDGNSEEWHREIHKGVNQVEVGDLAFFPSKEHGSGYSYSADGKRAFVLHVGIAGRLHEMGLLDGDEVLSILGHSVASLSEDSLDKLIESLSPLSPLVVKRPGETTHRTILVPSPK